MLFLFISEIHIMNSTMKEELSKCIFTFTRIFWSRYKMYLYCKNYSMRDAFIKAVKIDVK